MNVRRRVHSMMRGFVPMLNIWLVLFIEMLDIYIMDFAHWVNKVKHCIKRGCGELDSCANISFFMRADYRGRRITTLLICIYEFGVFHVQCFSSSSFTLIFA